MEKLRNLSIRKAIIVYLSISLVISFLIGAIIMHVADRTQKQIWWNYIDEEYLDAVKSVGSGYIVEIPRPSEMEMSKFDYSISEICDFLSTYSILVTSIIGVVIAVALFYRNKIQIPLEEMTKATQMIENNDLDFQLTYQNQDELGKLCIEFERMRAELEKNYREMWRMLEEEKMLRAAMVHDIRTPLATLRGYQEMLLEFVPEGRLNTEKTTEMLQEGMNQIGRIHGFVESMRKLSSLEQRVVQCRSTSLQLLISEAEKNIRILKKEYNKELYIRCEECDREFQADTEMILEVIENLASNAFRYAKQKVEIIVSWKENMLEIDIWDDGRGFQENTEQVIKAYYHSNSQDNQKHLGLGLYISRIYCEKHGGKLFVRNQSSGGAAVRATFQTNI